MSPIRYRDDDSSTTATVIGVLAGAIAGFAAGVYVAQHMGGIGGITERIRRRGRSAARDLRERVTANDFEDLEDYGEDELEDEGIDLGLEMRVLEAFRNDPILSERAVDIGSIGDGIIELAGWVDTEEEADHAVTLARGVPDVDTVVNRLEVGDEETLLEETVQRFADGDPALHDARWEGNTVGTGRRRQGTSDEPDRHADPKVALDERWSGTDQALRNAADDTGDSGTRARAKRTTPRGDRTGGSPVSPSGVPKADHVKRSVDVREGGAAADDLP